MADQEFTRRVRPEPVHYIIDAVRHAGFVHHLAQQGSGTRRFFRGFHDNAIPAGEGRSDLPGHEQQGQIPRTHHRNHSLGHAQAIVQRPAAVRGRGVEVFAGYIFDHIGKDAEVGRASRDINMRCQTYRLTGIGHLSLKELLKALLNAGGNGV